MGVTDMSQLTEDELQQLMALCREIEMLERECDRIVQRVAQRSRDPLWRVGAQKRVGADGATP